MKKITTTLLFFIFISTFAFMGCKQESSEPVTTEKTITDKTDPDFPKKLDGTEYPDGTVIEYKKVETDDYTTIDEKISCPDGTEVEVHILKEMEITTTKETTTFPESTTQSDKKTETIELTQGVQSGRGYVEDKTTKTELNDGTKITETYLTEGLTQKTATSKETINPDGSSEKESNSTENVDDNDNPNTKVPYEIIKTSLKKDAEGNITEDVKINIEAQASDGSSPVKQTKTTTNYSGSTKTGSIVETKHQNGPDNCGYFTKEVKDANNKTTSKEMEYYFGGAENYYGYSDEGAQDYEKRIYEGKKVKIIFNDDGTNKKYKITQGASDIPASTFHHNVMFGRTSYVTVLKVESDKITIVSIGGQEDAIPNPQNPNEWLYPVTGGTPVNEVYNFDDSLSFDSHF